MVAVKHLQLPENAAAMNFLKELKSRNAPLYFYGLLNFVAAVVCIVLVKTTVTQVLGISAFIKPLKFYLSIGIFVWTMAWYMASLNEPKKVKAYNWMSILVMSYESFVITWQAASGRLSHFNITSPLYASLFSLMGVAITILTIWTGYIGYLFFRKKDLALPPAYLLGIRLGIVCFVIFAFEGGVMASLLRHTIGAPDGDSGLPLVNWSHHHGDLRIAHFVGMHSLQLFPIAGYYFLKNKTHLACFALLYLTIVVFALVKAFMGLPPF